MTLALPSARPAGSGPQDLADLAGATREQVHQVLADLAASGRVRWARRHLKLRIGGGSGRRARADVRQG
jgi:DNA-binding IclR family transcriptional regulator